MEDVPGAHQPPKKEQPKRLTEAEKTQIWKYSEANKTKSMTGIAKDLCMTYGQVRYVLDSKGVSDRKGMHLIAAQKTRISAYGEANPEKSINTVATDLKVTLRQARGVLQGTTNRAKERAAPLDDDQKKKIQQCHDSNQEKEHAEIAEEIGVTKDQVANLLRGQKGSGCPGNSLQAWLALPQPEKDKILRQVRILIFEGHDHPTIKEMTAISKFPLRDEMYLQELQYQKATQPAKDEQCRPTAAQSEEIRDRLSIGDGVQDISDQMGVSKLEIYAERRKNYASQQGMLERVKVLASSTQMSAKQIMAETGATLPQVCRSTGMGLTEKRQYKQKQMSKADRETARKLLFGKGSGHPMNPASLGALRHMLDKPREHGVCDAEFIKGRAENGERRYLPANIAMWNLHGEPIIPDCVINWGSSFDDLSDLAKKMTWGDSAQSLYRATATIQKYYWGTGTKYQFKTPREIAEALEAYVKVCSLRSPFQPSPPLLTRKSCNELLTR
jgi:hypothetical protein